MAAVGHLFTSESVSAGHPDKLCDHVSDAILDACLERDPTARVAIETFVKGLGSAGTVVLGGEITVAGPKLDFEGIARATIAGIGYTDDDMGMDAGSCEVVELISQQSPDINQGIDKSDRGDQGAGDQGMMFGYATSESEAYAELSGAYMPLPILLAQRLTQRMTTARQDGTLPWARPDTKSQVTVRYTDDGQPVAVDTVVIAIQHDDLLDRFEDDEVAEQAWIRHEVRRAVVEQVIPAALLGDDIRLIVNGTGRFVRGGPHADAGLTGRKIIVDTYGGMGRHGGGAFSGKDASKVDRSAAYFARWAAKHIVASGSAARCEIQVAYAIGVPEPVSIRVMTFGTGRLPEHQIASLVSDTFDFRPAALIQRLGLTRPIFQATAAGGHFGREPTAAGHFSWERLDADILTTLRAAGTPLPAHG